MSIIHFKADNASKRYEKQSNLATKYNTKVGEENLCNTASTAVELTKINGNLTKIGNQPTSTSTLHVLTVGEGKNNPVVKIVLDIR